MTRPLTYPYFYKMVNNNRVREQYASYRSHVQKTADLRYAAAVLQWDQETYMPQKGANARARQIATLTEAAHEQFTSPQLGILLNELCNTALLTENEQKNIELTLYDYNRQKKLPGDFVRTLSEHVSQSYQAWVEARHHNSFPLFEKSLAGLIDLKKQEADLLGYESHQYDALLNEYERGCTVKLLNRSFDDLQPLLKDLLHKIYSRPQVDSGFLSGTFPRDLQWEFGMNLIGQLGFDFEAGRQDISEHPFTTNFSSRM